MHKLTPAESMEPLEASGSNSSGAAAAGSYPASTAGPSASAAAGRLKFDDVYPGIYVVSKMSSQRGKGRKFVTMIEK